jgi:hypothetical protein
MDGAGFKFFIHMPDARFPPLSNASFFGETVHPKEMLSTIFGK